jgi:hypothetical protein
VGVSNRRDIAIAEVFPEMPVDLRPLDFSPAPSGIYLVPAVGEVVSKSGRTTGFTSGLVAETDVLLNVDFGPDLGIISWTGTVRVAGSPFIEVGDSGAWVFDSQMRMAGMVFAGNETGVGWLINPLEVESYIAERLAGADPPPTPYSKLDILAPVLVLGGIGVLGLMVAGQARR